MATRALVTGAAGFLGSHLAERLLADGVRVTGVDCFTDYYDPALKRRNLAAALEHEAFDLLELDLGRDDLAALPEVDVVFHQAAHARLVGRRVRGLYAPQRAGDPAAARALP
jgi:UDP-glucose 4-epimerase